MAAPPEGKPLDKTVTFVQVLTVADVAEAAAMVANEMSQGLNQGLNNQIMQIVTMQAPNAVAAQNPGALTVVTTSQNALPSNIANATITIKTAATPADSKAELMSNPASNTGFNTNTIISTNASASSSSTISTNSNPTSDSGANIGDRLCMICGDRANGVHYNVLSCEGCKSFFLRSNRSGATFTCASGGSCSMDLYTRRHCPACRMKRCLECGMKVEKVWDKNRLKTRKPLIRRRRKKKVPGVVEPPPPPTPPVLSPLTPSSAPSSAASPAMLAPPGSVPPPQAGAVDGTSLSTTPSSSRSSSPTATPTPQGSVTVTSPPINVPPEIIPPPPPLPAGHVMGGNWSLGADGLATLDPATLGSVVQTEQALQNTQGSFFPIMTPAQEQLMLTLEKGYNASTEVLKHLSKDVPLFRMTYWSKLKGSGSNSPCSPEEKEDMDQSELKIVTEDTQDSKTNGNSEQMSATTSAGEVPSLPEGIDPLAVLSASTGQNIDVIYKLTSLATGGQIKDPTSALRVLASSEQGMRVIQSIGSQVQGQDLNTLISLARLVGQIITMGGGSLNDNLADTILGSITGSILNGSIGNTDPAACLQSVNSAPAAMLSNQDQNGNNAAQQPAQDEMMNRAAIAKLASSGLAEALAMLAAMASASQNKESIVEMVKRAAMALLKGDSDFQPLSSSSSSSSPSSHFYMPTDVGEDEVKTSPFLQSLQRVTSFLTSGNMSAGKKNLTKGRRTVNKEMLHIAMDMFAVVVKQTIHFAKSIPGFTNLACDDQAVLIKSSIVDALLLRCADSYALDKDCLVNTTNGDKFDMHMMYQLGFSTLPEVVFEFMRDTKACGLTTAEYALFTAAALLSPDRSDLKDRKTVEEMQLEMILALQAATKCFHPNKPFLFTKLITKLTTLRDMSILHLSEIMAVKVQEQDLSPLIVELFGLDS